jgi:hypothetical protein
MAPLRLDGFKPLNPAEDKLVAELGSGDFERLGDGLRPEWDDPERIVRAELIRFLILGGDEGSRLHEKGLRLSGARVVGKLDLEGCRIPRDIGLKDCLFDASPVLRSAVIDNLFLDGSSLPGLQADRLEARGEISMRSATLTGQIRLSGARIGGNIEADAVTVVLPNEVAFHADGLEVRGGILLRGADIRGSINLSGARVGADVNAAGTRLERPEGVAFDGEGIAARGDLVLKGATIVGEVRLWGADFGGNVHCAAATLAQPGGYCLGLNRANIKGGLFLRENASVDGVLDLTAATIGAIYDDEASWPQRGNMLLNRCRYDAFIGGPVDAESRLDWLARQAPERWQEDFWPQPYEQLSTVLRDMGHDEDARAVLIEKERLQRRVRRARTRNPAWRIALATIDGVLAVTVRYGRQPLYAFVWLFLFWAIGAAVFDFANRNGALKPNSPVVLRSLEWTMCALEQTDSRYMPSAGQVIAGRAETGQSQMACFLNQPEASSYPEFHPWMYSLDTLLPVTELGQREYWRPDPSKQKGSFVLHYFFFQSVIGWALSLLAIAGFSGLVKSR